MIKESKGYLFKDREISWMLFNERVLQEAENKSVPLLERLKFLAIFSSNNDEFFRVRVASIRRLQKLSRGKSNNDFYFPPDLVLGEIQRMAVIQQERFNRAYNQIIQELAEKKIVIANEKALTPQQAVTASALFHKEVLPYAFPIMMDEIKQAPMLKDRSIYLAVRISHSSQLMPPRYALVEVPIPPLNRFYILSKTDEETVIMYVDDVIRHSLDKVFAIFDYDTFDAYTIKITRDAEFTLDSEENSEIRSTFLDKIQKSIKQRSKGSPTRFIYDNSMPKSMLDLLIEKLQLRSVNLIPGGRYHNFKDFMDFPKVGKAEDYYEVLPPVQVPELDQARTIFDVISRKDFLLYHPYQSFDYLIRLLREAAIDPKVASIKITLYRVARYSNVVNALINALRNGKKVTVLMELQARFDEESNIYWTNQLQEAGARVHFGKPDQKVHCKILSISREEDGKIKRYLHLSTGNYNGVTARSYTDLGLFTKDPRLADDADKLFDTLFQSPRKQQFNHLVVAPDDMAKQFLHLIDAEIRNARAGKPAYFILKMNSLSEEHIVKKIYDASKAGVKISLIIRGICAIVPGVMGLSENIRIISIIDRYLEHARIFIFANNGEEKIYLSSADWMERNLFRRIESAFPVYDPNIRKEIRNYVDIQLRDNVKARIIDSEYNNKYVEVDSGELHRSQMDIYNYIRQRYQSS